MSIEIKGLEHIYDIGSPFETKALDNVSLKIKDEEFVGLIGHTGSGKSTLIQHMNGLLKPTQGQILINGFDITEKGAELTDIRKRVGLVFQYPEYQLFEETIEKDIGYGPMNQGLTEDEIKERVIESMGLVGLDYDFYKDKSPFDLSGGQKRRVAIAGVLAMKPEVLILDEPTAGLDPKGRDEILKQVKTLQRESKLTVILVSHSMEDVASLVDRIVVMNKGTVALSGRPQEVFKNETELIDMGLGVPQVIHIVTKLKNKGFDLGENILSVKDAADAIDSLIKGGLDA